MASSASAWEMPRFGQRPFDQRRIVMVEPRPAVLVALGKPFRSVSVVSSMRFLRFGDEDVSCLRALIGQTITPSSLR